MKALAIASLLVVASLSLAQDKVLIQPKWEKGQKQSLKFEITFALTGAEANMSGTAVTEAKEVTAEGVEATVTFDAFKLTVNGEEPGMPVTPYAVKYDSKGALISASGGVEGSDVSRTFILTQCYFPEEAIAKDGTWKQTIAESKKLEIGERTVEGTYLGTESIGGKDCHKFKAKMTEKGNSFTTEGTYWVNATGQIQKMELTYSNLPVPAAGMSANGTVKASIAG
ncbi:MAG: hypothetical protein ABL962_03475 [Fimbriimonadaceae bacterium]